MNGMVELIIVVVVFKDLIEKQTRQRTIQKTYLSFMEKIRKMFHCIASDTSNILILARVLNTKCVYFLLHIIANLQIKQTL